MATTLFKTKEVHQYLEKKTEGKKISKMLTMKKKIVCPPVLTELFQAWLDFSWFLSWSRGEIVMVGNLDSLPPCV